MSSRILKLSVLVALCVLGFAFVGGANTATSPTSSAQDHPVVELEQNNGTVTALDHPETVPRNGEFTLVVNTSNSAGTVVEFDSDNFSIESETDENDAVSIEEDRIEFLDPSEENSTYEITVNVTGGDRGDIGHIAAWVNAEDRADADNEAMSIFALGEDESGDGEIVALTHPETVTPQSNFTLTVETTASAGTVVEFNPDGFDVNLSTTEDDLLRIENNRIEFLDTTEGNSTYEVSVEIVNGNDGDIGEITSWVNAEERADADDEAISSYEIQSDVGNANFVLSDLEPQQESVGVGEPVDISANITNVGDSSGTQDIELKINDETVRTEPEVTLDSGEEISVTFDDVVIDDPGTYTHGVYSANDSTLGTLIVEDDRSEINISLHPTDGEVAPAERQTYDVVVENASDGINSFDLNVTLGNGDVGEFTEYELINTPDVDNTALSNTTVNFRIEMGDNAYAPADETTIARVIVYANGGNGDSTQIDLENVEITDTNYTPYEIGTTTSAVLHISDDEEIPPVIGENPPTDPDNDGLYEDINGDGQFDVFDVQAFFNNINSEPIQNNAELFDFDGSGGDANVFDVQALFNQL